MDFISNKFSYELQEETGEKRSLTVVQFDPIKIPVSVKDSFCQG